MATFKSTLFIAVQCCQCSTMQVKQQKKSSNKWTCVVCNQKQSVIKVYAQGCQAKQVRQYVQLFNMSRKFADDQVSSPGYFVEQLEGKCNKEGNNVEKRTDWSEYIDYEEDKEDPTYLKSKSKGKEEFEPEIVTEFPDERMFKKPKLKGSFDCSPSTYKPQFRKRSTKERSCSLQEARKEFTNSHGMFSTAEPGWAESPANNNNLIINVLRGSWEEQGQKRHISTAKTDASKWSEYMVEDEGDHFNTRIAAFADDSKLIGNYNLETDVTDERVEEDVHPDFL